jgi:hypothetical protein
MLLLLLLLLLRTAVSAPRLRKSLLRGAALLHQMLHPGRRQPHPRTLATPEQDGSNSVHMHMRRQSA